MELNAFEVSLCLHVVLENPTLCQKFLSLIYRSRRSRRNRQCVRESATDCDTIIIQRPTKAPRTFIDGAATGAVPIKFRTSLRILPRSVVARCMHACAAAAAAVRQCQQPVRSGDTYAALPVGDVRLSSSREKTATRSDQRSGRGQAGRRAGGVGRKNERAR